MFTFEIQIEYALDALLTRKNHDSVGHLLKLI